MRSRDSGTLGLLGKSAIRKPATTSPTIYGSPSRRENIAIRHATSSNSPAGLSEMPVMITELVINACKHAYAPGETGNIEVRLCFPSRTQFRLEVRDFGGGYSPRSKAGPPGLGTIIINAMCCKLDATFTYLANAAGTRFLAGGLVR